MLFFFFFKASWKKSTKIWSSTTISNFDNNNIQNIRMISKGSCDTEDCSNDAEKSALLSQEYIIF